MLVSKALASDIGRKEVKKVMRFQGPDDETEGTDLPGPAPDEGPPPWQGPED